MERSDQLLSIRPTVSVSDSTGIEAFQNQTLRPILKLQHPLTQEILNLHPRYGKLQSAAMEQESYEVKIELALKSDQSFRQLLIGVIVGQFTVEEYQEYATNYKEYNKRIVSMQVKRYVDTKFG